MWTRFAEGAALGFGAAASPGPFQAFLLSRSLRLGLRRALPLALAPLASDGPVVFLVLAALSRAPPALLRALQVAGGAFLLWLSVSTWRTLSAKRPSTAQAIERGGPEFVRAMLVNALGPGPWLYWSTVAGPTVVRAYAEAPSGAFGFVGGFYLLLVAGNVALVILFALARRLGEEVALALGRASAAILLAFGVLEIWRGVGG